MASAQRPPAAPDRKKLSAVGAIDNNQTDPNSQSHYKDNSTLDNNIAILTAVLAVLGFIVAVVTLNFAKKGTLSAVEAIDNNQTDPNSQSHNKDNSTLGNNIAILTAVLGVLGFIVAVVKLHFTSKKLKLKKRQIEAQKRTNERTNKDKQREIEIHQERNKLIEQKFENALQTILPFIYKFNLGSLRNKVCPIF